MKEGLSKVIFVLIQFTLLFYMAFITSWKNFSMAALIIITSALVIGVWAILAMGITNLTIFPAPKKNIKFTTTGPYKWVRHPMYSSVLLFSLGMLVMNPVWVMILAYFLLLLDLVLKLRYEENKLLHKLEEYKEYQSKTYRIIPFIY